LNFNAFVFYAIHNSKDAVVGVVITNGISLNFGIEAFQLVTVCIEYDSSSLTDEYPIFDFATRYVFFFLKCSSTLCLKQNCSDSDFTPNSLVPLGLDVVNTEGQLCSTLDQVIGILSPLFHLFSECQP
jgi:hypothetical protein